MISSLKTYTVITCDDAACGVSYALDDDFIAARQRDRATFYCPNKHPRWYPGKTVEQQLADEKKHCRELNAEAEYQERRARAYKGHATRIRTNKGRPS